ncbi:site-specific recombinase XerD [Blastococcus saxobsidens DD2] [Mycobacterium shimoidei]|uniref:Site-specific recombinase XerD [Blastococcus saxobsidens DD2] n=1 Tax=Mycobacterium shimoidei TaxID=29313 RepID=A0A375Z0Y4_MYCSH|nr:site-specific integrase [Mycobacterium shimoidei]SRX94732.1 site-specific recombinase XerD [Blastococcus saxobsidens DD2] [Mycobacterium shimoidei]
MTTRHQRAGIDDRWHKKVKGPDGKMRTERSPLYGKATRWRVRWVDDSGREHTKVFDRKPDAQAYLNKLTADVQRGDYVDPRKGCETFGAVAEQWIKTKGHRKPKTVAGYCSLLDTVVLPRWEAVPLKDIDYQKYLTWLGGLAVDGSQRGTGLSASRITQAHQLVGAVLKYAQRSGKIGKNVALEIKRDEDLPEPTERERRYLTHAELLRLARATERFETLTLVLGYCGLRFGEAAALRRKHVGDRQLTVRASATYVTGSGIVETTTKTNRTRHVPVPEPVWQRLKRELSDKPDALVFPSYRGGHLPIEEYRRAFDKGCAAVGIEGLVPHGLRHTTASLAISAGANVKVVQRLLGHASAGMTLDLYGHLFDDDLAGVAAALSKAIKRTAVSLRYPASSEVTNRHKRAAS